jgi:hypothetical protein
LPQSAQLTPLHQLQDLLRVERLPNMYHGDGGNRPHSNDIDISFYINLPIGAITILTISFLLPVPHQPLVSLPLNQKFEQIDFMGAFFLLPYFPNTKLQV